MSSSKAANVEKIYVLLKENLNKFPAKLISDLLKDLKDELKE